ncbi:MAG TPA: hypothetical protein VJH63_02290 [Candidatus Paceibacterota bacterium]
MKEIFQKLKLPLIVLAVLFAGFIIYNSFIKKSAPTALLQKDSIASSPEQNFLPILLKIQGVNLDERLFLDPVFRALVDWSQPIVPEGVGKNNPFSGSLSSTVRSSVESLGFKEDEGSATTGGIKKSTQ